MRCNALTDEINGSTSAKYPLHIFLSLVSEIMIYQPLQSASISSCSVEWIWMDRETTCWLVHTMYRGEGGVEIPYYAEQDSPKSYFIMPLNSDLSVR